MRSTSARAGRRTGPGAAPLHLVLALLLAGWPLTGCGRSEGDAATASPAGAAGPPWFEDVTEKLGVSFVHRIGPPGRFFMPEAVGSGCALFDFDNDGRLDLLLLNNAGPGSGATHRLFHQGEDGRFHDVSAGSGLDVDGYGMGAAAGDVNNDGLPDICVTEYPTGGSSGARLFLNLGGGKFREITGPCGIHDPHWGTSAAFVDYDRDGWLDLVVANYVDYSDSIKCADPAGRPDYCGPSGFLGTASRLYRNLGRQAGGDLPRFADVTSTCGLGGVPGPGLGVVCADFDGDGWQDFFIANDGRSNHLWLNRHDGTFAEEGAVRGAAYNRMGQSEANMGIGLADVDGDGLFDLFVTHLTEETHTLWAQGPRGYFQDRTPKSGLTAGQWRGTGFGTVLADFNNDGAADAALANGRVRRSKLPASLSPKAAGPPAAAAATSPSYVASDRWTDYRERNQLFANDGSGRFRDVSAANPALSSTPAVARGMAVGDLDNDGGLDLVVTSIEGPVRVLRNVTTSAAGRAGGTQQHWLTVRAIDPSVGGRDAYGVELSVRAGGRVHAAWVNAGSSYLSSNDPRAHVGLGSAATVEGVRAKWPDGTAEEFPGGAADQTLVIAKGAGRAPPADAASRPAAAVSR